jgi:hypothetical protein
LRRASPILALALALLAACGGDSPVDEDRAASGEVLEGTISDAMLPLDRVRSQPPLAEAEADAPGRSEARPEAAQEGASEAVEAPGEEPADEDAEE